jgi:hypothetical protein
VPFAVSSTSGAKTIVSRYMKWKNVLIGSAIITADTIPPKSATISGTKRDSLGLAPCVMIEIASPLRCLNIGVGSE